MDDIALSNDEFAVLRSAGYTPAGGGNINGDGVIWLKFCNGDRQYTDTRAEWRRIIAELAKPPTEDEIAFGKDAWVYCRQHVRPHETGWCGVSPRDKVGLGVKTAEEAYEKCHSWGFEIFNG